VRELLLGVDIGTSGSKGVLATPGGEVVAVAERGHALSLPRPGWAEHDAEGVWWSDVRALCADLLGRAAGTVGAVGVSGIGPCLLPADAAGTPLRPAILYGIDTRATEEIESLTARFGRDDILARCGSPLTTQAVGPKLLWLRRHEPEVWRRTRRLLMASSFVVHRLTGEYVLDHHSASQSDPLYDLERGTWIEDWAHEIAPGVPLPRLVWPADVVGRVTPSAAAATGVPAGTPVVAGTIDAWAEAASVGIRRPGDLMVMYGTTMFFVEVVEALRPHPAFWGTVGLFPGTKTLAGGMATSGALTSWFRDLVGGPDYETLLAEAGAVPAGSDGLVVLPYFAGERTPLFDPAARGVICGLTLRHGRGHLYRSLLEATAFGVRHNLEQMRQIGGGGRRLVAVGGGTRGGLWTQIVSDVCGRPQDVPSVGTGAAFGDAYLAGVGTGLVAPDAPWNPVATTVEPDPRHRRRYDDLYRVYRELYPATRDQVHALARLQDAPEGPDASGPSTRP
jgi:xylulokinase